MKDHLLSTLRHLLCLFWISTLLHFSCILFIFWKGIKVQILYICWKPKISTNDPHSHLFHLPEYNPFPSFTKKCLLSRKQTKPIIIFKENLSNFAKLLFIFFKKSIIYEPWNMHVYMFLTFVTQNRTLIMRRWKTKTGPGPTHKVTINPLHVRYFLDCLK